MNKIYEDDFIKITVEYKNITYRERGFYLDITEHNSYYECYIKPPKNNNNIKYFDNIVPDPKYGVSRVSKYLIDEWKEEANKILDSKMNRRFISVNEIIEFSEKETSWYDNATEYIKTCKSNTCLIGPNGQGYLWRFLR